MAAAFSPRRAARATRDLNQNKYAWQKYNAQIEAQKYRQPAAVGQYVRVGDRLFDPNSGKAAPFQPGGAAPSAAPPVAAPASSTQPTKGRNDAYLAQLAAQSSP